jgi:hypothetical protein
MAWSVDRLSRSLQDLVGFCVGFRPPAMTRPSPREASGGRKAPRHEIAGSGALTAQRALLEIELCTKIQGPLILNGCGRGMRPQLWRYGMDIANWGKYFSRHT